MHLSNSNLNNPIPAPHPYLGPHSHRIIIGCRALRVSCIIGIHPEERITPQELLIDCSATLQVDLMQLDLMQWEDAIDSTVSYCLLAEVITKTLIEGRFKLLETAAFTLVRTLLEVDPRLLEVSVHMEKKALPEAAAAFVSFTQQRRQK